MARPAFVMSSLGRFHAVPLSGDLAARAVLDSLPDSLPALARRYRRACNDEIGAKLRDSVLFQRYLFADRRGIAWVIEGAGCEQGIARLILDRVVGTRGYMIRTVSE